MPLVVKDVTWDQNETTVFITVPLKGVKSNKVDIFSSEEYLKVSYPPYIFECLLEAPVDDESSTAQVGNGAVVFKLKKKNAELWSALQSEKAADKEIMRQKRQEAVELAQTRAEKAKEKKAELKREQEKYTINEIMKMEAKERQRIEDLKESERRKATEDLEKWKEEQRLQAEKEKERLLKEKQMAEESIQAEQKALIQRRKRSKKKSIFDDVAEGTSTRESGRIEVKFTPRVFPTPVRESQTQMEEEWLKKQADASKAIELADKDLSEEEKNPLWLRDKGNSFFQAGDYKAAVNVYSHAIRLNSKMPALYSNRSACHLKLRNFFKCIDDCSKALDLLTPPVPQNAKSRCKAFVRRGTAFCELEMYIEGLQDYEAALKLEPDSEQLKADADRIRQIIQGSRES